MSDHGVIAGFHPSIPKRRAEPMPSVEGGLINGFFEWFGSLGIFSWKVLKGAVTPPYEWRELIRQLDEVGSKSLPCLLYTSRCV